MSKIFDKLFPINLVATAFKSNHEYINAQFNKVKIMLSHYLNAKIRGDFQAVKETAMQDLQEAEFFIRMRLKFSENSVFMGEHIKNVFKLSKLQWFAVCVSMLVQTDKKYLDKFLKIENFKTLTYNSILKLYFFVNDTCEIENYYEIYSSLVQKMNALCFENGTLNIDKSIFEIIMRNEKTGTAIPGAEFYIPKNNSSLVIRENLAQKLQSTLECLPRNSSIYYFIYGESGIGKKTILKRVCDILNKTAIIIDFKSYAQSNSDTMLNVQSAYRNALLNKSFICLENLCDISKSESIGKILNMASDFAPVVFVFGDKNENIKQHLENKEFLDFSIDKLTNDESYALWKHELKNVPIDESLSIHEMANKFDFTPLQIKNTAKYAIKKLNLNPKIKSIDKTMLCAAAYSQVSHNLSDKATLIKKKHSWDELVMKPSEKEVIRRACNQMKYKHIVYDKWGMKNRILYGRGLSMLFTGPPGTGKTMAAQVVANELGLEIYKVDLSRVISKYIGESEKNLGEVFDNAKKSNVILLFDETDALFGKRTEVKDSHDRNANVETSYLLQKMEEYDGITIMTTNFLENIDKAFFRRINYVVHFSFPDVPLRKEIWMKMYPKETPLSKDIDFEYLAKNFEIAGGSIKNAVLTSSFMAAAENCSVGMKQIIKAIEYEIKKQGKMVSKSDFGKYGYLI